MMVMEFLNLMLAAIWVLVIKGGGFAVYTGHAGSDVQLFDDMKVGYLIRIPNKGGGLTPRPLVGLLSLSVGSLLQTLIGEMEVKGLTAQTSFADFATHILQVDDKLSNQVLVATLVHISTQNEIVELDQILDLQMLIVTTMLLLWKFFFFFFFSQA